MPRGGKRPGAGRPRGSCNVRTLSVPVMLPALASPADHIAAAWGSPIVQAEIEAHRGRGELVAHVLTVEISLERSPRFAVRAS